MRRQIRHACVHLGLGQRDVVGSVGADSARIVAGMPADQRHLWPLRQQARRVGKGKQVLWDQAQRLPGEQRNRRHQQETDQREYSLKVSDGSAAHRRIFRSRSSRSNSAVSFDGLRAK
ncbi:MAG: hypothetical protein R2856_03785 [Caldilineaceae bacterium]